MMFKDKYIHKLYAFALAAVFALTLAGCGGGGGTAAAPDPEPTPMPEPTAQEMCEGDGGRYNADGSCTSAEELAAEMTEAEALSAAQEGAMAAASAAAAAVAGAKDPVAMANAQPHATAAMAASASAAAATTSAMAMEHQAAAEAARDMAMEAAGERGLGITKLANAAANKSAIDSAELVGVPPPAPISNAGRVGRALSEAASATLRNLASADLDGDTTADTLATLNQSNVVANASTAATDGVTVAVRHTGSAPRFTVNAVTGGTTTNELMRGETPTAIMSRGGWSGAELVDSSPGATAGHKEYAVVFTDINPPAQQYATTGANYISQTNLEIVVGTTGSIRNQAVITGDVPGDGSHFAAVLNSNPTDNNPAVSGRFQCVAAPCSISVNSSGVLLSSVGYEFRPAIPGSVSRQDSDFLAWGVWVSVPNALPTTDDLTTTDAREDNPATAAAFASGSNPFEVPAALTGTATYNGVASGLYSAAGMIEYFEADASLTADFGGRSGVDSNPRDTVTDTRLFGAVTGSITNIKAGGMDVEGSLTLGRAPVVSSDTTGTPAATPATTFSGSTGGTLGGRAMSGRWAGQFYGPNRAVGVGIRTEFPTTAAGTFGATTAVSPGIRILGSFGTRKVD